MHVLRARRNRAEARCKKKNLIAQETAIFSEKTNPQKAPPRRQRRNKSQVHFRPKQVVINETRKLICILQVAKRSFRNANRHAKLQCFPSQRAETFPYTAIEPMGTWLFPILIPAPSCPASWETYDKNFDCVNFHAILHSTNECLTDRLHTGTSATYAIQNAPSTISLGLFEIHTAPFFISGSYPT